MNTPTKGTWWSGRLNSRPTLIVSLLMITYIVMPPAITMPGAILTFTKIFAVLFFAVVAIANAVVAILIVQKHEIARHLEDLLKEHSKP